MTATSTISATTDRRVSEELGLWEPKRALTLEAALAHSNLCQIKVAMSLRMTRLKVSEWGTRVILDC